MLIMIIEVQNFVKTAIFAMLMGLFSSCSIAPQEGVFTEISDFYGVALEIQSVNGYYSENISDNTVTQTLSVAQDWINNHGGIIIHGVFNFTLSHYCCFYGDKYYTYVIIFKRDNLLSENSIEYVRRQDFGLLFDPVSPVEDFYIDVTFDDSTISTPENHTYTLEFWECLGECAIDDYDLITDKKGEIIINYSVVP
jgi:hypothetical protein